MLYFSVYLFLSFNFTNEYFALEGEAALTSYRLSSLCCGALGLALPEYYTVVSSRLDWLPYLQGQFSRIGVASIPFFLPGYVNVFEVGYGEASNGLLSVFVGTGMLGASLIGLIVCRYKILVATLISAGIVWALTVRHSGYVHDFEALFYIGIPLTCFSLVLLCIRRLANDACWPA